MNALNRWLSCPRPALAILVALGLAGILLLFGGAPAASATSLLDPTCTPGDQPFAIEVQGHIGGSTAEAVVQGDYAYVAQGATLVVLDLTGPAIRQVAFLPLPQEPRAMAVAGQFAYLWLRENKGFVIVNIANPRQPAITGQIPLPGDASALGSVHVRRDYAYVAAVSYGLYVVHVRDPAAPVVVKILPGNAYDIVTAGNYAYLVGRNKLQVLSLANPADPQPLGEVAINGAQQVRVVGAYAFVSQAYITTPGLSVVDVSVPTAPRTVAFMPTSIGSNTADVLALDAAGTRAYLAVQRRGVRNLIVANIANPLAPAEVGRMTLDGLANSIQAVGERVYLAVGTSSAGFLEINPAPTATAGATGDPVVTRDFRSPWDITWLHPARNILYVASADGLWVYDVADLKQPALLRHYEQWRRLIHLAVQGNLLFAIAPASGSPPTDSLLILDATDPTNLTQRALHAPGDYVQGLAVRGSYAYLLTGLPPRRFQVVNVSNPDAPALAGEVVLSKLGRTLHAGAGAFAYVGYGEMSPTDPGGIAAINVSNPASPTVAGTVALTGAPIALSVEGNRLAAGSNATAGWRVELFDITNPAAPAPVAHNATTSTGTLWSVELRSGVVFAGAQGQTVFAFQPGPTGLNLLASLATLSTVQFVSNYMDGTGLSTVQFVSNYMDGTGAYGYGAGFTTEGYREPPAGSERLTMISGDMGARTYAVGVPPSCGVTGKVMPQQAAAAGCSIAPVSAPCRCGDPESRITFVASQTCRGWEFRYFSNANPLPCPASGTVEQVAWFGPSLTVSGGGTTDLCLSATAAERKNLTALTFNLCASDAVDWEVSKVTFQASGSGNDQTEIEKVQLKHRGAILGGPQTYPADNGKLSFSFPAVTIPQASCETFTLLYDLKDLGSCTAPAKEFRVAVQTGEMTAEPKGVGLGTKSGAAAGGVIAACVWNENTHTGYDLIQPAVSAAADGHTIAVCPGSYTENVDVARSLTVRSTKGRDETSVAAATATDHVFHLQKNDTTLDGFTVTGATGSGKAGVYVGASAAGAEAAGPSSTTNIRILNSFFTGNYHGIHLKDTQNANVKGNLASNNAQMGLLVEAATRTTIENNSFSNNARDGVQLLNCQDAAQQTRLSGNGARENQANGIHVIASSGIRIENNLGIRANGVAGVLVERSDGIEVAKNPLVQENGQWGIGVVDSQIAAGRPAITIAGNAIEGNLSSGKQPVGVYLNNSRGVRVGAGADRNTIRNHPRAGISLENCTGGATEAEKNVVDGNRVEYNGVGVLLKASCGNIVRRANAIGPGNSTGLALEDCRCAAGSPNEITDNETINENQGDGIALRAAWGQIIARNAEIKENGGHGIHITQSNGPPEAPNRILNNAKIARNQGNGVQVRDSRWLEVADNQIAGNAAGVWLSWTADVTVRGNQILGQDGDSARQNLGIALLSSQGTHGITGNTISGNSEAGVDLVNSHRHVGISGNTISGGASEPKQRFGVRVGTSCNVYVDNETGPNVISDHSQAGIYVRFAACEGADQNVILGNTLRNNSIGIRAERVQRLWIGRAGAGNTVRESTTAGILLEEGVRSTTVEGNSVGPGNLDGIRLENCNPPADAPNRVISNGVGQNTRHGIVLAQSFGNIIGGAAGSQNTIVRNGGNGLRLENCDAPQGRANIITYNQVGPGNRNGVVLDGTTRHQVTELTVQGNTGDGIWLRLAPDNQIFGNAPISNNTGAGIRVEASDNVQIYATEARGNTESGIVLAGSHNAIVGRREQPVKAVFNQQHGLQLDHCTGVTITGGEYDQNTRDGIRLNWGGDNAIYGKPLVRNNRGDGIGLEHSSGNVLLADQPGVVQGRYRMKPVYGAQVLSNAGSGIGLRGGSNGNRIENFLVQRHSYGVLIESSNNNLIQWNQIVTAGICVNERSSTGNKYMVNTFLLCGLPVSPSAHVDGVTAEAQQTLGSLLAEGGAPAVTGNLFEEDAGDAVTCQAGAAAVLHKNSFVDIAGFGLVNRSPAVTVDARENWWGDSSGPGGAGPGTGAPISGPALFQPWRPITVSMVVDASPGVVYAPRGVTSVHTVTVFDWDWPGNDLTVTVADVRGWLAAPGTFTVSGVDIVGVGIPITFTVPASAALGASDTVTVTAVSAHGASDADTFRIVAAAGADLALTAAVQPAQPLVGTRLRYTLVVVNNGPDPATSVVLSDTLAAGLTFVSAQASQGACTHTAGVVTCPLGNLARGASASTTIVARAAPGMVLNRAAVTSALPDPDPRNNETALYSLARLPSEYIYLPLVLRHR